METFRRDHSRALNISGSYAILVALLLPAKRLRAQEVDKEVLIANRSWSSNLKCTPRLSETWPRTQQAAT